MEIDKNNEYFGKIVELTDTCLKRKQSTAKDIVDDTAVETMKNNGLGIEFVYSELHIVFSTSPFIYNKLYFQLEGNSYNDEGFYNAMGRYGGASRGPFGYSEELINIVPSIKYYR